MASSRSVSCERRLELARAGLGILVVARLFKTEPQCRQRGPQLMRDVRRELTLARHELGDPAGTRIQSLGDRVDLRNPVMARAHREVAVAQLLGAARDRLQRPRETTRLQRRQRHRGEHAAQAQRRDQQPRTVDARLELPDRRLGHHRQVEGRAGARPKHLARDGRTADDPPAARRLNPDAVGRRDGPRATAPG